MEKFKRIICVSLYAIEQGFLYTHGAPQNSFLVTSVHFKLAGTTLSEALWYRTPMYRGSGFWKQHVSITRIMVWTAKSNFYHKFIGASWRMMMSMLPEKWTPPPSYSLTEYCAQRSLVQKVKSEQAHWIYKFTTGVGIVWPSRCCHYNSHYPWP